MRGSINPIVALLMLAYLGVTVSADDRTDCFSSDNDRSIPACTKLITQRHASEEVLSSVYAKRGLAYSLKGRYMTAIRDYDAALRIKPAFGEAIANRAWAYFHLGKLDKALPDVERALELLPGFPYAFDTRAHIRQALGQPEAALRDYDEAMSLGGTLIVRLYQCGLAARGIYKGETDGVLRPELRTALEKCVHAKACSPVPLGEQCPDDRRGRATQPAKRSSAAPPFPPPWVAGSPMA